MNMLRPIFVAVLIPAFLQACGRSEPVPPPDGVLIRVDAVVAKQFEHGRATACTVDGAVVNTSKFKIDNIAFDVGDLHLETSQVHSGQTTHEIALADAQLAGPDGSPARDCADVAQEIVVRAKDQRVLDCAMANVPEGDCQKLTIVSFAVSNKDVAQIRTLESAQADLEQQTLRLQQLPLPQALTELMRKGSDDLIADFVVRTDSLDWFSNHYADGSAHVTRKTRNNAMGTTTLRAEFGYIGGQSGWVNITLNDDKTLEPCVEFWDFAGSCRVMHIPDAMKPPAVAPAQVAPPPPAAASAPSTSDAPQDSNSDGISEPQQNQDPAAAPH
jgi:hypothetical protein